MTRRRALLAALLLFPFGVFGEAVLELNPTATADEMRPVLQDALQGQSVDQLLPKMAALGARDVVITDLAALDLPDGAAVADGLVAGDKIVLVLFGLRRGLFSIDRRVRLVLPYDEQRLVTGISDVTLIAK